MVRHLEAMLSELPDVVANDRSGATVGSEPGNLDLRTADHEVGVNAGDVDPVVEKLLSWHVTLQDLRQPIAKSDMASCILVEQRVAKNEAGLLDRRGSVDERDLAEERRLVVRGELLTNDLGT